MAGPQGAEGANEQHGSHRPAKNSVAIVAECAAKDYEGRQVGDRRDQPCAEFPKSILDDAFSFCVPIHGYTPGIVWVRQGIGLAIGPYPI